MSPGEGVSVFGAIPGMRQSHIPTDAQIIARTWERPAECSELYRRHARAVFRYAASRLGREHADDVVSETLLVAFERRNAYDLEVASALPWLLGIATRLIRKRRREEAVAWRLRARVCDVGNEEAEYAGHDPTSELDERLDAQHRVAQAADAISSLPARDRDVLMLTAWSGLDAAEIAVPENPEDLERVALQQWRVGQSGAAEVPDTPGEQQLARALVPYVSTEAIPREIRAEAFRLLSLQPGLQWHGGDDVDMGFDVAEGDLQVVAFEVMEHTENQLFFDVSESRLVGERLVLTGLDANYPGMHAGDVTSQSSCTTSVVDAVPEIEEW